MSMVIKEALSTEGDENTPYAALIVKQDRVIVCVHNETEKQLDPTNHAEINAIRCACQLLKTTDLSDCILFATCEPCPMCFGAAWGRILRKSSMERPLMMQLNSNPK